MAAPRKSDPAEVAEDLLTLIHKHGMPALIEAFGDLRPTERTVIVTRVPCRSEKLGEFIREHVYGPVSTGTAQRHKKRFLKHAVDNGYQLEINVHKLINAEDEEIPAIEEWA